MDINDYARRKQNILTRMLAALLHVFQQFITGFMSARDWDTLMHVSYRIMKPYRDEGTQLAREFYDDNRAAQTGSDERHDIFTDDYYPEKWFRQAMLPTFQKVQQTQNAEASVEDALARTTKIVEDAQRRTLIQGITTDTGQPVRGFARFDPRPPTCAFCTMMISRGPVYLSSGEGSTAGWPFGTKELEKHILNDDPDAINELMNKWHPDCTCIVVPVYKYDNYPSQSQENEAFDIYDRGRKNAVKEARKKGVKLTTRLILNEMRKLIYNKNAEQDEVALNVA